MKDCWVTSNKLRNGSAGWPLRPGKVAVLTAHQWPLPRALCIYKACPGKIIEVADFSDVTNCEIEDLIPINLMRRHLDRLFRDVDDEDIFDVLTEDEPIIPQIEQFAKTHQIQLDKGWKVELSKSVKQQLLKAKTVPEISVEKWIQLFEKFNS